MNDMKTKCEKYIEQHIDIENVVDILLAADMFLVSGL